MKDFRCTCGKLLARMDGAALLQIKCPRCRVVNHWNAMSVRLDSPELPTEMTHVSQSSKSNSGRVK
ncbi:MAG: Com family DNA-binding transcriptional regulator [Moraxellaceae bacterium]|nr:MAG: Com family DNA-binding transcriptional regulator [Moraxellaceae bacterium]